MALAIFSKRQDNFLHTVLRKIDKQDKKSCLSILLVDYLSKNDSITWAIMLVLFPSKKHKK
ncbi:MAG: hypothetical protein ACJAVF_004237 [Paraglaciecola sp.]|jgi:hypothetical protein